MTPITKDTPVGTRVIVLLYNDTIARDRTESMPYETQDGWKVNLVGDEEDSWLIDRVFLDEPTPGTWAWACERLFAGEVLRRPVWADGQAIAFNDNEDLAWVSGMFSVFVVDRGDLTATDWEIAP